MREMIAALRVSTDGFIEGPHGELDWAMVDDAEGWEQTFAMLESVDTCVLGRVMYPGYQDYWMAVLTHPHDKLQTTGRKPTPNEIRYAQWADKTPHVVLSKTMERPLWKTTRVARDIDEIRQMKAAPGRGIYVVGGATTVSALTNAGLIDKVRMTMCPIILGGGKPLFKDVKQRQPLRLADSHAFNSGAVELTYAV
jgi:dihydrofolate reductase